VERGTRERGFEGEDAAARFLEKRGLRVIERQYLKRGGEIDLICKDKDTWVFVEVKSRHRSTTPSAADALTPNKQRKIVATALMYMKQHRLNDENMRFDVVTIEGGVFEWYPNAFEPPGMYTF
jgi:putative endonuclease